MNQVMYFKVLLCLVLAITLKRINGQSSACGQPTPPYGSTIIHPLQQNQHNSGSVVLFGCKEGFYLVGMPIIRCTGNTWTTIKFRCLGFCPEIGHILNGQVVHVTPKVGQAAVQFHCNITHRLIGKPRLECINGRWNGVLPFCEKLKSCAPLSTPGNGTLHGSDTSHGAKASFACLTGFDLFGSRTLTCSNGVWNTITPTCKAQCEKITDPLNGQKYGTRFSHGAIASFECNVGYKLVGSRSLLCVDGKWNASVPVCNAMLCPRPSIPPNSYIIYPGIKGNYVHGIKLFLGCRDGYYLTGSPIMDCNQTVWSKVELRCIAKCPVLGQLKNGIITHVTLRNGGEVEIKCLTNYTLDGSSKLFCRNGKWSDGLPTCGAPCLYPGIPGNGSISGDDFRHDRTVRYTCKPGFGIEGDQLLKCSDGRWIGNKPQCKVCRNGSALGMSSRIIPDSFIQASSAREGHPAYHARLGGKSFWCSQKEHVNYLTIDFPRKYKITSVSVNVIETYQGRIHLFTEMLNTWFDVYQLDKLKKGFRNIAPSEPFIGKNVKIQVMYSGRKIGGKTSVCLRAEVYGCEIPQGCLLTGSAVIVKANDRYVKTHVKKVCRSSNQLRVTGYTRKFSIIDAVLDETPDPAKLTPKTLVLVKNIGSGSFQKGIIERKDGAKYWIKTESGSWASDLNDVRLDKSPEFCLL